MRLRKIIIRFFLGILSLLLASFGYYKFLQYESLNLFIPKNTSAVIRINAFSIFTHLMKENFHFSTFRKRIYKNENGLDIPMNIYGYSLNMRDRHRYYFPLNIKDERLFLKFSNGYTAVFKNKEMAVFQIKNHYLYFVKINGKCIFIVNFSNQPFSENWITDYNHTEYVALKQSKFKSINNSNSIVSVRTAHSIQMDLSILDDELVGTLKMENAPLNSTTIVPRSDKNNVLDFWINGNALQFLFEKFAFKSSFLNPMDLKSVESIHLFWNKNILQKEHHIDYTTDENFNMTPSTTIDSVIYPRILLTIKSNDAGKFYHSMQEKGIVLNDTITKKYFPLFKLYSGYDMNANYIHISNDTSLLQSNDFISTMTSDTVFSLKLNIQNPYFKEVLPNRYWNKLQLIEQIRLTGKTESNHSLKVDFSIPLKNTKNKRVYSSYLELLK